MPDAGNNGRYLSDSQNPHRDRVVNLAKLAKAHNLYPYFRLIENTYGTEVTIQAQNMIMLGSNDYLGLSQDPRVKEAVIKAVEQWGTSMSGSRLLCGNSVLHQRLEDELAAFLMKKRVLLHTTGFDANYGCISNLLTAGDHILVDREAHASIICGCMNSQASFVTYRHNDLSDAKAEIDKARQKKPGGNILLITEGVFSMSGDIANLPGLVELRQKTPNLFLYLDDAHGLGTMGAKGAGTAEHFGLTDQIDFIMATFSKAFASIGGFVASNDVLSMEYLRNNSRPLIFSAALPAPNVASILTCLEILRSEPERLNRLRKNTRTAIEGYTSLGLSTNSNESPILPIQIGQDWMAAQMSLNLLQNGIFAPPVTYPAVPKQEAMIRTAYHSTHTQAQIERVIQTLTPLVEKYHLGPAEVVQPFEKRTIHS